MEIAKDYGEKWFLGHAVRHLGVALLTLKLFIFPTSPFYEANIFPHSMKQSSESAQSAFPYNAQPPPTVLLFHQSLSACADSSQSMSLNDILYHN